MKNLVLALGLASVMLLSACGDDEPRAKSPLVGTWYLLNSTTTGCTTGGQNGIHDFVCSVQNCEKLILSAGGSLKKESLILSNLTTDTGTYLLMGDYLEVCIQSGTSCSGGDYTMNQSKDRFSITQTDGATGCVTTFTYAKL